MQHSTKIDRRRSDGDSGWRFAPSFKENGPMAGALVGSPHLVQYSLRTCSDLGETRSTASTEYVARDPKLVTCTTPKDRSGFSPRPKNQRWTVYSMTEVARSTPQVSGVVTRAQGSVCSSRQQWHDGLQIFCCSDDPCEGRLFRIEIRRLESACALGRKDASSSSCLPLVKRSSLAKQEPKTMRFFRNRLMRLCIERSGGHR